jgi:hypothetical protein
MNQNSSPKADKTPQTSPEAPFESSRTDSAGAWHFEPIFVDFETLDFRIERSGRQP